jgi:MFS family permease
MLSTLSFQLGLRLKLRPRQLLWLLYALFFMAGLAQAAIVPLLPRLATLYDLSPSETAMLLALPGLSMLAVSVPAGLAADRFGARPMTLAAGGLLCLSCLAQAAPSLALVLAGRIAFGVSFGLIWTTGMAWLSDIDTGTKGGRMGPAVMYSSVGVMGGPAFSGILAQRAGLGLPFVLIALVSALVTIPLTFGSGAGRGPAGCSTDERRLADCPPVKRRRTGRRAAPQSPPQRAALIRSLRRPGVGAAAGGLVVSGAVAGISQLLITMGLHDSGLSTSRIGLAFSVAAVCYIVASAWIVRLGERAHTLRFNALATLALALALLPALTGDGTVALLGALLLTASPRAAISTVAYSLASTPDGDEGGSEGVVFGMLNGGWAAATVLMPLLAGVIVQHGGVRAAYLAVIVPSCAIAGALMMSARRHHAGEAQAGIV